MIALIDGDLICHQYTSPKNIDKPISGKNGTYEFPFWSTVESIENKFGSIMREAECDSYVVIFSDFQENYRKSVLESYKGHRKNRKPIMFMDAVKHFIERKDIETRQKPTLEADDVMGILATLHPGKFVLCSIDKDMLTIPGLHFNYKKEFAPIVEVNELEAFRLWVIQLMAGDPADGYKGAPGVGPVSGGRIADQMNADNWWELVVDAFGGDEESAIVNAQCARILWAKDFDFEKREPILWQPPKK